MRLEKSLYEELENFGYQLQERQGRPPQHFLFDYYCDHFVELPINAPYKCDILLLLLTHGAQPNEMF